MSAATDAATTTDALTDFLAAHEFTPTCEHSQHGTGHRNHPGDEPAAYLVRATCPTGCGWSKLMNLCHPGWIGAAWIHCLGCDESDIPRDAYWRIVHVFGGEKK